MRSKEAKEEGTCSYALSFWYIIMVTILHSRWVGICFSFYVIKLYTVQNY